MTSNLKNFPPNWQKVRFDEIVEIATDRVEDPIESGLEYFIGLEHLDTDCIRIKRFGSSKDVCSSKFICKKGDIIFGRRRSYLRKVAISDRDAVVSTDAMVFRPSGDKIYPDFLPCFMQSSIFWKIVHANSEGSMSPRIKWKALATQEFWLPSIEEQKKISELLWSIEDNIQKTEKLLETTEKLKEELLRELLRKGIGHTRFKDTELGSIPEEWEIVKQGDIASFFNGRAYKLSEWEKTGTPVIRLQNLTGTGSEYYYSNLKLPSSQYVNKGDLLYMWSGSFGPYIWNEPKAIYHYHIWKIECKYKLNKLFMYYVLHKTTELMKCKMHGIAMLHITKSGMENQKILLPPLPEQQKIASIFSNIDTQLSKYRSHIEYLSKLKKILINKFVSKEF